MDRLKSAISYWHVIAIVGVILAAGWGTREVVASKVDVSVFDPFKEKTENRLTKAEDAANSYGEDIKLIKNQMWMIAIATHATIVPQPLPKSETDGGVK